MITKTKNTDIDDLATKVIGGVRKALRKLAENAAANNETMIVSDKDGNIKSVPAKELLRNLEETEKA